MFIRQETFYFLFVSRVFRDENMQMTKPKKVMFKKSISIWIGVSPEEYIDLCLLQAYYGFKRVSHVLRKALEEFLERHKDLLEKIRGGDHE